MSDSTNSTTTEQQEPPACGAVIVRISAENLAELLGLPPTASIHRMRVEWTGGSPFDTLEILICGEGLPIPEPGVIPNHAALAIDREWQPEYVNNQIWIDWDKTLVPAVREATQ